MLRFAHLIVILVLGSNLKGAILVVPDSFATIQSAIDSSANTDTVLIRQGRYLESVLLPMHNITVGGEYLISADSSDVEATTIAMSNNIRTFRTDHGSMNYELNIVGLRLVGTSNIGGGFQIVGRNLNITHCIIDSCRISGGSIFDIQASSGSVSNTSISHGGSSFNIEESSVTIRGCSFRNNNGLSKFFNLRNATVRLPNCEFLLNGLNSYNHMFAVDRASNVTLDSCRIYGNHISSLLTVDPQSATVQFQCKNSIIDSNAIAFDLLNLNGWASNSTVSFQNNTISNTTTIEGFGGLYMIALATFDNILGDVTGNLFLKNHRRQVPGVFIDDFGDFSAVRNYFIENTTDGFLSPPGGPVMLVGNSPGSFRENIFHGNEGNAVDHFGNDEPGFAEHNYWGDASGPYNAWSNPEGLGDTVDTLIFYEPWEEDTLFLSAPDEPDVPITFALGYPYPNPFNSSVTIEYALTREQEVTLEIFDVLGRKAETLFDERQAIGVHSVLWKADGFATGLYFARLTSDEGAARAVKLMLLK